MLGLVKKAPGLGQYVYKSIGDQHIEFEFKPPEFDAVVKPQLVAFLTDYKYCGKKLSDEVGLYGNEYIHWVDMVVAGVRLELKARSRLRPKVIIPTGDIDDMDLRNVVIDRRKDVSVLGLFNGVFSDPDCICAMGIGVTYDPRYDTRWPDNSTTGIY